MKAHTNLRIQTRSTSHIDTQALICWLPTQNTDPPLLTDKYNQSTTTTVTQITADSPILSSSTSQTTLRIILIVAACDAEMRFPSLKGPLLSHYNSLF